MKGTQAIQEALRAKYDFSVFDDFHWLVTAHTWTTLVADTTPTVTVGDARGGICALFTDTTDNNEVAIRTTAEIFKPTADRPMYGVASIQYSENDTNKANVFVGFASAIGANLLVDNGAGVRTSGSVFCIYKVDGGTVWRCHTRNGSDYTDSISSTTAGGSAYQQLEIIVEEFSSTHCVVTFKVDGAYLRDATTNAVIEHRVAYASNTEMHFGVYAKSGGGAGGETVNVDWAAAGQVR